MVGVERERRLDMMSIDERTAKRRREQILRQLQGKYLALVPVDKVVGYGRSRSQAYDKAIANGRRDAIVVFSTQVNMNKLNLSEVESF